MVLVQDVILSDDTPVFTENMIHTLKQVFDGSPEIVKKEENKEDTGQSIESFVNSTNNDSKVSNLEITDLAVLAVIVMLITFSSSKFQLENMLSNQYMIYLFYAFSITIFFWLYFKLLK